MMWKLSDWLAGRLAVPRFVLLYALGFDVLVVVGCFTGHVR